MERFSGMLCCFGTSAWRVVCLIFHLLLEMTISGLLVTGTKREVRYKAGIQCPKRPVDGVLALIAAGSINCRFTPFISLFAMHDTFWRLNHWCYKS